MTRTEQQHRVSEVGPPGSTSGGEVDWRFVLQGEPAGTWAAVVPGEPVVQSGPYSRYGRRSAATINTDLGSAWPGLLSFKPPEAGKVSVYYAGWGWERYPSYAAAQLAKDPQSELRQDSRLDAIAQFEVEGAGGDVFENLTREDLEIPELEAKEEAERAAAEYWTPERKGYAVLAVLGAAGVGLIVWYFARRKRR